MRKWLYSKVEIPEFDSMVTELIGYRQTAKPWYNTNNTYTNFKYEDGRDIPITHGFFERLGLFPERIVFSSDKINHLGNLTHIHIDGIGQSSENFAFNIPLINCEKSWTHFYDVSKSKIVALYPNPGWSDDGAVIIDSVQYNEKCGLLVNNGFPHRGYSELENRIIVSFRFDDMAIDNELISKFQNNKSQ
jgi:hypothetical protein